MTTARRHVASALWFAAKHLNRAARAIHPDPPKLDFMQPLSPSGAAWLWSDNVKTRRPALLAWASELDRLFARPTTPADELTRLTAHLGLYDDEAR